MLDKMSVRRIWDGRNAGSVFGWCVAGVNNSSEREYRDVIRTEGTSTIFSRRGAGRASSSPGSGGEAYIVVSSVMRSMSHFLRWAQRPSGAEDAGLCKVENADVRRE
jgi:hypothetical protein